MTQVIADLYVFTSNNSSHYSKIYIIVWFFCVCVHRIFIFETQTAVGECFDPAWQRIGVGCVWLYCVIHILYLGLRQAQFGCQVSPLGQGEVLGLLEALIKRLELQAGVNGPRLPDLLPLPVQPHLPVLYHCCGLVMFWREESQIMQR